MKKLQLLEFGVVQSLEFRAMQKLEFKSKTIQCKSVLIL